MPVLVNLKPVGYLSELIVGEDANDSEKASCVDTNPFG
jgi:hypothetical protein